MLGLFSPSPAFLLLIPILILIFLRNVSALLPQDQEQESCSWILRCRRFINGQHSHAFDYRRGNPFEMRANTAQRRCHKRVDKTEAAIKPGKKLTSNLVMQRQRDFGAIRTDLSKFRQTDYFEVAADGFKRHSIRRSAVDR